MGNVSQFIRARWGWFALALALVVAGIGWAIYQQAQAAQAQAEALAALRTERLQRGNLIATVSATGSLQPTRIANLTFLIPGTVQEILVKRGDAVQAGQVLARLDAADLQLAMAQAEDALRIAELRRKQLLDGPSEDDIAIANANVRSANAAAGDLARGAGPQEAEIAKLNYDKAAENFRKLNEQYNNLVQFANDNPRFAPPQETLDQLKQNQENAYYQAEITRLQYEQSQRGGDPGSLSAAYARINQAKAQLAQLLAKPGDGQVQQADLSVAQAQLALEQAQQRLSRAELRAPFDGVIATVGEPASGFAIVLLDASQFVLDITVNEVDVAQLAVGQVVNVTVDALPDAPLTGAVQRIAPTSTVVGGAVNYLVRIALDRTGSALRAGMSATVEVTTAEATDVVLAPNWAIRRDRQTGQAFLSLKRGDTLEEAPIETGLRGESYTEVKGGAEAGDEAAVSTKRETPFGGD
ncbi:MAG: efflux RND transporter periplasmic adaptor subunit [Anaerolineales bacterium]